MLFVTRCIIAVYIEIIPLSKNLFKRNQLNQLESAAASESKLRMQRAAGAPQRNPIRPDPGGEREIDLRRIYSRFGMTSGISLKNSGPRFQPRAESGL
jgi:hypothetical protein